MITWLDLALDEGLKLSESLLPNTDYTISCDIKDEDIEMWANDTFLGHLTDGYLTFQVDTSEYNMIYLKYKKQPNWAKLEKGSNPNSWQPAPEDLQGKKGKTYQLSSYIDPYQNYILSLDSNINDFICVWGDNKYFLGYLNPNETTMKFKVIEDIKIKSITLQALNEVGIITGIRLKKESIKHTEYKLSLLQLNEKPLGGMENFYDFSFSPAFADIGELSFNLPKYTNDDSGNKVLNQMYERISEDMLIEVNGEHIFYIDRVSEKSDKDYEYKEVHAYSREYELSHKRLVNYKVEGRFLYYIEPDGNNGFPFNDSTYPEDIVKFPTIDGDGFHLGLFNEIERLTSWRLKRDLVTGHPIIPTELAKKTRGFDISDANLTEVLKNIQEAFGCIFTYDTKNREIEIIEVDDLIDSGFMISDKNFIESITKDLQVSKTITRLNVYDKDGKGIGRKMAHGKDYIENYSYYMNDKFMSEDLISALQEYIDINNSYMTATSEWWNLYDKATAERSEVELIILKYKEELIPHFATIDILTTKRDGGTNADGTVIPPGSLTSAEIAQLNNAQIEYDRINKKIKTLEEGYVYTTPRSLPAIDYDINRAKDELDKQSGKVDMESVFSDYEVTHSLPAGSLMDEMDSFIKIDTHILDYSANLEDIYQAGIRALNKVSKPHLQFEIGDLTDFLQIAEYEDLSNALQLGAYTIIEHTGLGFYDRVLLLNYTHKPDSNSISLRFSDTLGYFEEYSDIAQLIAKSSSVGSRIDLKSSVWSSGGFGSFENAGYLHQNIKAVNIEVARLEADKIGVSELYAVNANIENLQANKADIEDLTTINASIMSLQTGKADIADLTAIYADISTLQADYGEINTLLTGNLTAENFQANSITATSGVIANGAIVNAMIANLDAGKINAGRVNTSLVEVGSESGNLTIADNTIHISDNYNITRVQIGKDASDDYNMYVWDADGNLMFDATGLHADGIKSEIIRNDMIAPNANISGSKLNISSVVEGINNGVTRIESANINYNGKSLNVAFGEMESYVDDLEGEIDSRVKITDFTIEQGRVSALISDVETIEGDLESTTSKVATLETTVDGINSSVSSLETDNDITKSALSTLTQDVAGFKTTVQETYSTKGELSSAISTVNQTVDGVTTRVSDLETKTTTLEGDLAGEVDVRTTQFEVLSTGINSTVERIENLVIDAENRLYQSQTNIPFDLNVGAGTVQLFRDSLYPYYKVVSSVDIDLSASFPNSQLAENLTDEEVVISLDVMTDVDSIIVLDGKEFDIKASRWTRIWVAKTLEENTTKNLRVRNPYSRKNTRDKITGAKLIENLIANTNTIYYRNLQVQKGYIMSSHTLTPEELEDQIERFSSEIRQLADEISLRVTAGELSTEVIQNAESWGLSINGKLEGQTYNFNGQNFTIGGASGDRVEHDNQKSKYIHSDGSYTQIDASGLKRYVGSTGRKYHHMALMGETFAPSGQEVTIMLPSELKGKSDSEVLIYWWMGNIGDINPSSYAISWWQATRTAMNWSMPSITLRGSVQYMQNTDPTTWKLDGTARVVYIVIW